MGEKDIGERYMSGKDMPDGADPPSETRACISQFAGLSIAEANPDAIMNSRTAKAMTVRIGLAY